MERLEMQNYIWLILGKSGTGKSYLARHIVEEYIKQGKRKYHIVIDLSDEHFYSGLQHYGFKLAEINRETIQKEVNWIKVLELHNNLLLEVTDLTCLMMRLLNS
jgi:Cdc6-like AAA superfamily ATPase